MPTPATAKWPKPKSEDEFEDLSVDFLRIRWKDPNAQRHGRRGQGQHGVDVVGHPPWLNGKTVGGQSKNTEDLTLAMVLAEVDKAKTFPGGLAEFYVVTSGERDAALQNAVRQHFKMHPAPFDVELVFWPDITADVSQDETLVAKHWKGFGAGTTGPSEMDHLRGHLATMKVEAHRMNQDAETLTAALFRGWWRPYLPQKFRPAILNNAYTHAVPALSQRGVVLSQLDKLLGAAAAADSEAERVLNGRARNLDEMIRLAQLVASSAHQAEREVDRVLATCH